MMKFISCCLIIYSSVLFAQNQEQVKKKFTQLRFIENKGQWHKSIDFKTEIPNGTAFFSGNKIAYSFKEQPTKAEQHPHVGDPNQLVDCHNLIIQFKHASKAEITGSEAWSGEWNYLLGNDAEKWTRGVKNYKKITYSSLYRGVNMEVFQKGDHLKYQFIVDPKSNTEQIEMTYSGAQSLEVNNGQLHIQTSINSLVEDKPYAYQIINDETVTVACEFIVNRKTVSFELGDYDDNFPLVIDPDLIFSTYSGSPADNWGNTACQDKYGNVIVGGIIYSDSAGTKGFPTTVGAFQSSFQGGDTDILIFKLDSLGQDLIYATYLGGDQTEVPTSFVVDDRNNELLLLATSGSSNFPTTASAYDRFFSGGDPLYGYNNCQLSPLVGGYDFLNGADIVVTRLSEDGSELRGSTYLGGTGNDGIIYQGDILTKNYGDQLRGDIIVDENGFVYIASNTHSGDFPQKNAFQPGYGGGNTDGVVVKLNPNLDGLVFSTLLGGSADDACFSVKLDNSNQVFVAGGTESSNFPTKANAFNENINGDVDAFVSHFSFDGSALIGSTFAGTSKFDQAYFMDLGPDENVYLFGQTRGNYPVTPGKYSNTKAGQFIHKLDKSLETSIWSTVIGSSNIIARPNISPTAFLVNDCGMILFSGWGGDVNSTTSTVLCWDSDGDVTDIESRPSGYNGGTTFNMPITKKAFLDKTDGSDFYLCLLNDGATDLLYGTYFGADQVADHVDGGTSRFDKKGIIYQSVCAGCRGSNAFPQYPDNSEGEYPKANGSVNCNNGIFKFNVSQLEAKIGTDTCTDKITLFYNLSLGGNRFDWDFGDGTLLTTFDKSPISHTYADYGNYKVNLRAYDEATCLKEDEDEFILAVSPLQERQFYSDSMCVGDVEQLTIKAFGTDSIVDWSPKLYLDDYSIYTPTFTAQKTVDYSITVTDTNGCQRLDSFHVFIPVLTLSVNDQIIGNCIGKVPTVQFKNNSIGVESYLWDFGDGNTSEEKSPSYQFTSYGEQEVELLATTANCRDSISFGFTLYKVDVPNVITPNNDGKNDNFHPSGIENSGEWNLDVYNRWGKLIYQEEDYLSDWNGESEVDGVYYYLLTAPDDSFCKGWLQVIR
jgi:gliding motility-associated-like protein